jgi:hypothetical protein
MSGDVFHHRESLRLNMRMSGVEVANKEDLMNKLWEGEQLIMI